MVVVHLGKRERCSTFLYHIRLGGKEAAFGIGSLV